MIMRAVPCWLFFWLCCAHADVTWLRDTNVVDNDIAVQGVYQVPIAGGTYPTVCLEMCRCVLLSNDQCCFI